MPNTPLDKIIIKKLFSTRQGKNFHRRGLQHNISEMKMNFSDHSIRFNPHDSIGARIYSYGTHTRKPIDDAINLLIKKKVLKNKSTCIEFGSNIGTHTIYMHLHKCFKKIYAIEPEFNNNRLLLQNLKDNNLIKKTKVLKLAISNVPGNVKLFKDNNNSGAHSLLNKNLDQEYELVEALTPQQLLKQYQIDDLGFAFFDIEGMEIKVIPEFIKTIKNNLPIFFEFTPHLYNKKDVSNFISFLDKNYNNFIFYQESKVKFTKNEFKSINDLLNINFEQCDILAY